MAKHLTKQSRCQEPVVADPTTLQITAPLWDILENAETAFHGLCTAVGIQVLQQMMEIDRIALCGPAGHHDSERQAGGAGSTTSPIVVGGCRLPIRRPRVRSPEGELSLPSFEAAAREDPLNRSPLAALAAGASMRRYQRMQEPEGGDTVQGRHSFRVTRTRSFPHAQG